MSHQKCWHFWLKPNKHCRFESVLWHGVEACLFKLNHPTGATFCHFVSERNKEKQFRHFLAELRVTFSCERVWFWKVLAGKSSAPKSSIDPHLPPWKKPTHGYEVIDLIILTQKTESRVQNAPMRTITTASVLIFPLLENTVLFIFTKFWIKTIS